MAKQLTGPRDETKAATALAQEKQGQVSPGAPNWSRPHVILLFSSVTVFYLYFALARFIFSRPKDGLHFVYLADGWLHGHLYIHDLPSTLWDYTLHNGHWYVSFPPLPAVLMLPLVAIFHLNHMIAYNYVFAIGMSVLNIGLILWVLHQFARRRGVGMTLTTAAGLLLLFVLGSEFLYVSLQASVWYMAHVVATTFLLLYIGTSLSGNRSRAILAGIFLGLAFWSRTTTLFTFPLFVLLTFAMERANPRAFWKQVSLFCATLAVFVAGMLLYNEVRFGSFFDFGYASMNVYPSLAGNLHTYGQFNLHFFTTNLRYMLFEPPRFTNTFPYLSFSPSGTSIFLTMPALFFVFLAFLERKQRWLAFSLLAACLLPMAVLLLYFNTGSYQFGYRFSLDFLPCVLLLAALGMQPTLTWREKLVIALSVGMNVWGLCIYLFHKPL